jgi:ribosomal protein S18 acetylase RimI-like enzyme
MTDIIQARDEHVADIAALAKARSLEQVDPGTARREGFLVSGYEEDVYRARLAGADHFHVAVDSGALVGFVLAYSNARFGPDEWLNHAVAAELGRILVIKQVCVARDGARRGVGSLLYRHVLERWQAGPVIAAVVADPPNEASAAFHRKHGFTVLTTLTPPDGRPRNVWMRPPVGTDS